MKAKGIFVVENPSTIVGNPLEIVKNSVFQKMFALFFLRGEGINKCPDILNLSYLEVIGRRFYTDILSGMF